MRRNEARRHRHLALVLGPALIATGLILTAAPAGADAPAMSGGAYGLAVGGLLGLGPTPAVSLPPSGGGPYVASQAVAEVAGLVDVASLNVSTQGDPSTDDVESSAAAQVVEILHGALAVGGLASSCTSDQGGTTGTTTVTELQIEGVTVAIPNPVPPDFGISVPGVATAELNYQTTDAAPGSTSITVDALHVTLLGGLVSVNVASSSCETAFSGVGSTG